MARRVPAATQVKDQFQASVDFIEERGPVWQTRMGLDHFEISHHYLDASSDLMLGTRPKDRPGSVRCGYGALGETTYTAFVETRWNYQMASVYFILPSTIQWDQTRLDQTIVHEYTHILLAPEQYLLELAIEDEWSRNAMQQGDLDTLAALYYERLEMATENAARAVYSAHEHE